MVNMADIGRKIKGAATDAAKGKGSSDKKKGKSTGGSGSGMDKAKSAVKNRLK
jgi:hypothetical protein